MGGTTGPEEPAGDRHRPLEENNRRVDSCETWQTACARRRTSMWRLWGHHKDRLPFSATLPGRKLSSWRSLKPCELGARHDHQFEAVPQDGAAGKGEDLGGGQHHARRTWRPVLREVRGWDSRGFEAEQLQPWKVSTGNCLWPARAYICRESKDSAALLI